MDLRTELDEITREAEAWLKRARALVTAGDLHRARQALEGAEEFLNKRLQDLPAVDHPTDQ